MQIVNILLNFGVHFLPELFVSASELFHKKIKMHEILGFDADKILINFVQGSRNPHMLIPIVLLLPFDLGQASQPIDYLFK